MFKFFKKKKPSAETPIDANQPNLQAPETAGEAPPPQVLDAQTTSAPETADAAQAAAQAAAIEAAQNTSQEPSRPTSRQASTETPDAAPANQPEATAERPDEKAETAKGGWLRLFKRKTEAALESPAVPADDVPAGEDSTARIPTEVQTQVTAQAQAQVQVQTAEGDASRADEPPADGPLRGARTDAGPASDLAAEPATAQAGALDKAGKTKAGKTKKESEKAAAEETTKATSAAAAAGAPDQETDPEAPASQLGEPAEAKKGWFGRLRQKLASTREMLAGRLEKVLSSVREIDEDVLDELEEILITSDLGVKTSQDVLRKIRGQVAKKELKDSAALKKAIKARIAEMIELPAAKPPVRTKPWVLLVIGVNGVGKTTTIAKLAQLHRLEGRKVLLAAGDTFRAAAVEQLTIWGQRLGCDVVSQPTGADASAVVFDALTAAQARGADVVIVDTAGRLHTKANLMDELKKIKRVAGKALPGAPHETILVIDANTGQNAARQAQIFNEAVGVDSLIVTKLDGTSKGGVIVSIIYEQRLPVTFVGLGETFSDLKPFDAADFVEAVLGPEVK
ncbi:MAG: signal recognition particle-docking protein FtsY [Deltaproteobacteria bacterium]|jgi:fused signal recognition particle receptor|nr:signal recognition particle-docking protein FtsY [Deltaproteobacteria bacterium]